MGILARYMRNAESQRSDGKRQKKIDCYSEVFAACFLEAP